jgi:hypothetical protein
LGVHCSIYKGSYNVSNISFFPSPSSDSWNSFNRYHFCMYIHVYTLFAPYSSPYSFPCHLPPPTGAWDGLDHGLLIYASWVAGMTEAYPAIGWDGVSQTSPHLSLNQSNPPNSTSWVARIPPDSIVCVLQASSASGMGRTECHYVLFPTPLSVTSHW